jgi:hypothetical protein
VNCGELRNPHARFPALPEFSLAYTRIELANAQPYALKLREGPCGDLGEFQNDAGSSRIRHFDVTSRACLEHQIEALASGVLRIRIERMHDRQDRRVA